MLYHRLRHVQYQQPLGLLAHPIPRARMTLDYSIHLLRRRNLKGR